MGLFTNITSNLWEIWSFCNGHIRYYMVGPTRKLQSYGPLQPCNIEYGNSLFDIRWSSAMYIRSYDLLQSSSIEYTIYAFFYIRYQMPTGMYIRSQGYLLPSNFEYVVYGSSHIRYQIGTKHVNSNIRLELSRNFEYTWLYSKLDQIKHLKIEHGCNQTGDVRLQ